MKSALKHTALILLANLLCWPLLAKADQNVLILSSVNRLVPWQGSLERGVLERAQEIRFNAPRTEHAELYFASVDWFRKVPERSLEEIAEDVIDDFEWLTFEKVIVIGQPASHVFELAQQGLGNPAAEYVDTQWPSSYGLDSDALRQPERVYQSLREIYPSMQRLIYLGSNTHSYQDEVSFDTRAEIEFLARSEFDSHDEWETLLSELGAGDLVLVDSSMMRIGTDLHFPYQIVAEVGATTDVPILVTQSPMLELDGVLGGLVLDSYQLGRALADIAEGQTPDLSQLRQHVYNYSELERFGLNVAGLTGDAEIRGEPVVAISTEQLQGYVALGLILLGAFILAWLYRERSRNRKLLEVYAQNSEFYAELKQRERNSGLALDAAQIAYYAYEHSTGVFQPDQRFKRLYGAGEEADIDFSDLEQQIHPEDRARVIAFREQAYEQLNLDEEFSVNYRIRPNGGQEYVWLKAFARQYQIDDQYWTLGCIFSIDAEMRAQLGYEQVYQHLKAACQVGGLYLLETNLDSGEVRHIISPTRDQKLNFTNQSFIRCVDPSYRHAVIEAQNKLGVAVEFPLLCPDWDAPRWTRDQVVQRWIDDNGQQHIVILSQDIDEAHRAEQAVADARNEAQLALLDLERTTAQGGIALMRHDLATDLLSVNDVFRRLFDFPQAEYPSISFADFCNRFPVRSREQQTAKAVQARFDGELNIAAAYFELRDGSKSCVRVQLKTHFDEGEPTVVVGSFVDISELQKLSGELKEIARQRQAALESLERRQQTQQQMFAVIGHELRTPAAALSMLLDSQRAELTDEEVRALPYAKDIDATTKHLMDVLDDLRAVVEPQIINFRTRNNATPLDVVEGCLTPLRDRLKTANLRVQINSVQGAAEPFSFDAKGMRQIITNLVKNAAIHSGASELKLGLLLELNDEVQKQLRVELADNGKGIPREQWESIFEPFARGDTEADGTGLGLHICREIARASGGELILDASEDGGCRFTLLMPLEEVVEEPDSKPISLAVADSLDGKSILFAEDNLTLRMLTEQILKGLKAQYRPAINGAEALAIAAEQDFDLVLTDIFMPEVDGFELVETLRKRGFNKPIIGITAAMVGDETERLLAAGADIVVPKPVTRDKLEAAWSEIQEARPSGA